MKHGGKAVKQTRGRKTQWLGKYINKRRDQLSGLSGTKRENREQMGNISAANKQTERRKWWEAAGLSMKSRVVNLNIDLSQHSFSALMCFCVTVFIHT